MQRRFVLALIPFVAACGGANAQSTTSELATPEVTSSAPPAHASGSPSPSSGAPFANAREVVHSDQFKYGLSLPSDWVALDESQRFRIHRDTQTAYATADGTFIGAVVVIPVGRNVPLGTAADRWAAGLRGDNPHVLGVERTTFQGHEAAHARIEVQTGNMTIQVDAMMFLRDRHLVCVQSLRAPGAHVFPESFFAAYHDLEGTISSDDLDIVLATGDGPGWRVHDHRYEDYVGNVVIELPSEWDFLDRWPTRDIGSDIQIAMKSRGAGFYAFESAEHVPVAAQPRWRAALDSQNATAQTSSSGPPETLTFEGTAIPARVATSGGTEMMIATTCRGDTCVSFGARWAEGQGQAARAFLAAHPPVFRWMTPAERRAAPRPLPGAVRDMHVVGIDDALHGGHYTDYAHGVRFTIPDRGAWKIWFGREAASMGEHVQFVASDFATDIRFALVLEEAPSGSTLESVHRTVREHLHGQGDGGMHERRAGQTHLIESEIPATTNSPVSYRIVTALRGTTAMHFEVAAIAENMRASHALVEELVRSFQIAPGPIDRSHRDGDRYVADQLGYSLRIPADWAHEQSPFGEALYADRWTHGDQAVFLFTQGPVDRPEGARGQDVLLGTLRTLDSSAPGDDSWQNGTMGGLPARVASWNDGTHPIRSYRGGRDRTGYLFLANDEPSGAADALVHTFEFTH